MRSVNFVREITIRMMAWGAACGAVLGFLYGGVLLSFGGNPSLGPVGGVVGFIVGSLLGLILGLLDGLVLATITHFALGWKVKLTLYRLLVCAASIAVTALVAWIGFSAFTNSLPVTDFGWTVYTLVPTLIAVVS